MTALATEYVDLPGGRFAYLAAGPSDGPLVLLLHGFPDIPRGWEPAMHAIAASGRRAVAPWLRGYAPSTLERPVDVRALARDAIDLADALSPHEPVDLVGHDWGALIAYAALALKGERFRRAVTMSVPHPLAFQLNIAKHTSQLRRSWYIAFFQLPFLPERRVARDDFCFIDDLWRVWSPGLKPDPAYLRELKDCLSRSMPVPIEYYRALKRRDRDLERAMVRIDTPLLYLHGADDGCVGAALGRGQDRFFGAELRTEIMAGAGHFLQLEQPERVAELIAGWLA